MKAILTAALLGTALLSTGCGSTRPTKTEQTFFTVVTNYVPVVYETNVVLVNESGEPVTNTVTLTNYVEGYDFTPNTNAGAVVETGAAIGDFFGVGGLVGTILAALFGLWGKMRSTQALKTAGVLAEIIEAGRKVLATTPQGQQLESQWVAWMSKHQTETGVVLEVAKLLRQVVNVETAQNVANQLIDLAQKAQPRR